MAIPPPVPPDAYLKSSAGPSKAGFPHIAGILSCIMVLAILGVALMGGVGPILHWDTQYDRVMKSIALIALLIFVGVLFGIIALCGVSKYGRRGLLAPALLGTVLNAALAITLAGGLFSRIASHVQAQVQTRQELTRMAQEVKKDMNSTNGISAQKLDRYKDSLQNAAQNLSGDDSLVMKASAEYISSISDLRKNVDAASSNLLDANVLRMVTVTNVSQFEDRKKLVQGYLDANEALKNFFGNGADQFSGAMRRWHVPENRINAELRGYRQKADAVNPKVVAVRDYETRISKDMLSILSLEEANWGSWSVDALSGTLKFDKDDLRQQYKVLLTDIRAANTDEKKAEMALLAAQRTNQ